MSQSGIIHSNSTAGATTYATMAGNAAPAAGILHIVGAGGVTTSGAGATVTITSADPSLVGTGTTIGAVGGGILVIPLGAVAGTYMFDVKVAGFDSVTPSGAGYHINAAVRTTGAAAVLVSNQVVDSMTEAALVTSNAQIIVLLNTAIVQVTGVVGLTINWKAVAEYAFIS